MVEQFKALGDENRLRILNLLMTAELCVCEMEVILEMTQSNVSRHLGKLKKAGIISAAKDAQWVHYKISHDFMTKDALLFKYLQQALAKDDVHRKDLERYNKYKTNHLDCRWIAEDKEKVLNLIK